jgi:pycsar effector protein
MGEQKNQHAPGARHRASSRQKSAHDTEEHIHQQSIGIKPAGDGKDTAGTVSSQIPHEATSHNQEEEVTKATILLFEHIEEQIGRADTKAQLTLAADALLAGTLAALEKGAAKSFLSNTSPILDRFADLFTILMFLALVCSFYWALRVINPHLHDSKRFTLMYFGRIAQMSEDDFINTFGNQSLNDLEVSTLAQVHTKARIAQIKFARVRWSVNFLIASLVFWAIIQLLLAFS